MGRASSAKKVARASKAAAQPGTSRSFVWPLTIGLVVLLGVGLIAISAVERENTASAAPILGDHWHAAQGVYACDTFLPPLTDVVADESGIHSHGDGIIHIHPFSTRYAGSDANLAAFGETTGLVVDDDSISVTGQTFENGDDCDGQPGIVQVKVWAGADDPEGRLLDDGFAELAPQDGDIVTIAFAPDGTEIPKPPSTGTQPTDVAPAPGDTAPPGAPSTLPIDEGAATEAPVDGTGSTAVPPPTGLIDEVESGATDGSTP